MTRKAFISITLAACFLTAFMWQRKTLSRLRHQNEVLFQTSEEMARLVAGNEELLKLRAANAAVLAGDASTDLLRLRNEARQLRAQQPELDRLRDENGRLAAEISSGAIAPQRLSEMEGFMAKESWSNVGFDTPEAAVQTFFWAVREGDVGRMAECMPTRERQYLLRLTEQGNEQERERALGEFQGLTQGSGFRIVNRTEEQGLMTQAGQSIAEGTPVPVKVILDLQAAAGGAVITVQLSREADGWKVKGF